MPIGKSYSQSPNPKQSCLFRWSIPDEGFVHLIDGYAPNDRLSLVGEPPIQDTFTY
jgi:hypothetical protein